MEPIHPLRNPTGPTDKPITPEQAKDHVGESASVHAFLNFGGRYPDHIFTGFVPAQNVERAGGGQFLQSLAGSQITLTGKIELYKGRPEIVISSRAQIAQE